jgi:hypothetical protein
MHNSGSQIIEVMMEKESKKLSDEMESGDNQSELTHYLDNSKGFMPGLAMFITFSTLISNPYVGVGLGIVFGGLYWKMLTKHTRAGSTSGKVTRLSLAFFEVVGVGTVAYDAIGSKHSLPRPFNQFSNNNTAIIGISLVVMGALYFIVLCALESKESKLRNQDQSLTSSHQKKRKKILIIKGVLMFFIFLITTYALMQELFQGFNGNAKALYAAAVFFAVVSSFSQALLIMFDEGKPAPEKQDDNDTENNEIQTDINSNTRSNRELLIQWFGLLFMSIEVILSCANTAFSNRHSSFSSLLDVLSQENISSQAKDWVGGGLFAVSIVLFLSITWFCMLKRVDRSASVRQNYKEYKKDDYDSDEKNDYVH